MRSFFDDVANEVEVGLGGRREADLDLLEAHLDELDEHRVLAVEVHRVDEGLVAVAQVDAAPARRLGQSVVGPGAVRQVNRHRRRRIWRRPWGWAAGCPSPGFLSIVVDRETKNPRQGGGRGERRSPLSKQQVVLAGSHGHHSTSHGVNVQRISPLTSMVMGALKTVLKLMFVLVLVGVHRRRHQDPDEAQGRRSRLL